LTIIRKYTIMNENKYERCVLSLDVNKCYNMENSRIFYDYIVVGCGGIGSATVYWLSKRAGTGKTLFS
jgi:tRNA A37 threonylcarbamoyladenosine dehydratase